MGQIVERSVSTRNKEENITGMVVFPFNEEDMKERFGVEDFRDLYFTDKPEGKMSINQFNHIIRESDVRIAKIVSQIEMTVKFVKNKFKGAKGAYKGVGETIPLNFADSVTWYWFLRDFKHKDENVKVWKHGNELTVLYGEGEVS